MAWEIKLSEKAERSIASLDIAIARRIKQYLDTRIATDENPRRFGKKLQGKLNQFWRYRVGDYRIICEIQDKAIVVLVINEKSFIKNSAQQHPRILKIFQHKSKLAARLSDIHTLRGVAPRFAFKLA